MSEDTLTEPTHDQYAKLGRYVAACLGAETDWSRAGDIAETIAEEAQRALGTEVGGPDRERLRFWREIATELGIEFDADDECTLCHDEIGGDGYNGYCGNCYDARACRNCGDDSDELVLHRVKHEGFDEIELELWCRSCVGTPVRL